MVGSRSKIGEIMGKIEDLIDRTEKWKVAMVDDIIDNILRQLSKKSLNLRAKHIIIKNIQRLYEYGIPGWGFLIPRKELNHKLRYKLFDVKDDIVKQRDYCKSRNIKLR
jgi:uncharacterized membrane-anchored protein YjiN (DUF445 family)